MSLFQRAADVERISRLVGDAHALVDEAIQTQIHEAGRSLSGIVGLFSGGNDSTTLVHMFRERLTYAAHANTGIGIEQTRQYVRDTCSKWGLPLMEEYPTNGATYRDLVLGRVRARTGPNKGAVLWPGGFPGPAAHYVMYQKLKERALDKVRAQLVEYPYQQRVIYLAGRRADESGRRKGLKAKGPIERRGSTVWVSPLLDWTKLDLNAYRRVYSDVPRNEVSDLLHMSAECLCGAFAHAGELDEIGEWFPETADEIRLLEKEVLASGVAPPRALQMGLGRGQGDAVARRCHVLVLSAAVRVGRHRGCLMRHLVQYSTGVASAEVAWRLVGLHGPGDVHLLTADTQREDPDNWRFAREVADRLGCDWTTLADGRNPMQVGRDLKVVPNNRMAVCSRVLKRELLRKHIDAHYDPADTTIHLGYDWTEQHRIAAASPQWDPYPVASILAEPPLVMKEQLHDAFRSRGIEPPAMYALGYQHANCGGGCVRGGQAQWALKLRVDRPGYLQWESEEQEIRDDLGKDVAILRDRTRGTTTPLTLRAFRERIDRQPSLFDPDDWGACGCFSAESGAA